MLYLILCCNNLSNEVVLLAGLNLHCTGAPGTFGIFTAFSRKRIFARREKFLPRKKEKVFARWLWCIFCQIKVKTPLKVFLSERGTLNGKISAGCWPEQLAVYTVQCTFSFSQCSTLLCPAKASLVRNFFTFQSFCPNINFVKTFKKFTLIFE